MDELDKQILIEIANNTMPFGKYKGKVMMDIPVSYLEWMANKGFPKGRLGMQLQTLLVVKSNGLQELLYPLRSSSYKKQS